MSRPAVHPVEAAPMTIEAPRVRMKDFQGMPGTTGGLFLRLCQFVFAVVSLCVMTTTLDFPSVTAFCYLVAAVGLQSVWSLSLAIADIYCLSVRRSFRHVGVISLFAIGDGVRKTCLTRQLKFSDAMLFLKGRDAAMYLWKRCDQYLCENATLLDYFPTRN
ncbi:CASP 5A1 [Olea europaea subsp. europaea]|uniref:CASP-like protein n=1 Tax=Olea europaea subsp. europaea TaxID=158383 RepID=A0A8S0T3L7_OLEEU|nr:CASP 5A1 [Olea europaea subsp. europaea]